MKMKAIFVELMTKWRCISLIVNNIYAMKYVFPEEWPASVYHSSSRDMGITFRFFYFLEDTVSFSQKGNWDA